MPFCMIQWPINTRPGSGRIDYNHEANGESPENIEREIASLNIHIQIIITV